MRADENSARNPPFTLPDCDGVICAICAAELSPNTPSHDVVMEAALLTLCE